MIDPEQARAGLQRVERLNLGLSAGAVAASFALASPGFASSLAAGAAIEALNFRTLHASARRLFAGELAGAGLWLGVVALRLALVGAAIVLAISAGAQPVALVIGLSLVMPAVLIDAWRHRPDVIPQPDHPVPPPDHPAWDRFSVWRFSAMDDALAEWPADATATGDDAEAVAASGARSGGPAVSSGPPVSPAPPGKDAR
jgi:hypothetical protein